MSLDAQQVRYNPFPVIQFNRIKLVKFFLIFGNSYSHVHAVGINHQDSVALGLGEFVKVQVFSHTTIIHLSASLSRGNFQSDNSDSFCLIFRPWAQFRHKRSILSELKIKKETSGIPRYVLCPVPTGAPTHRGVDASSPVFRLTDLDLPDVLFAINMRTRFRCADDRQRGDSIARRPVWDSNPRP